MSAKEMQSHLVKKGQKFIAELCQVYLSFILIPYQLTFHPQTNKQNEFPCIEMSGSFFITLYNAIN